MLLGLLLLLRPPRLRAPPTCCHSCTHSPLSPLRCVEQPGGHDFTRMFDEEKLTHDQVAEHYVFFNEYLWDVLDPDPVGTVVSVYDLKGANGSDLAGKIFAMFKLTSACIQSHYMDRSKVSWLEYYYFSY